QIATYMSLAKVTGLLLFVFSVACRSKNESVSVRLAQSPTPLVEQSPSPTNSGLTKSGAGQYEFNREQAHIELGPNKKIISKELRDEDKRLKFEVYVSFPQFEGSLTFAQTKFNSAIAKLARREFETYRRDERRPLSKAERFP